MPKADMLSAGHDQQPRWQTQDAIVSEFRSSCRLLNLSVRIGCTTVTSAQVSAVKPPAVNVKTLNPTPGKTISMNWAGPPSEVGG
jgi:hypothetical protein